MFVRIFNSKKTLQIVSHLNLDFYFNVKILIIFFNHRIFLGLELSLVEGALKERPLEGSLFWRSPELIPDWTSCIWSVDCERNQRNNPLYLRETTQTKHKDPETKNPFYSLRLIKKKNKKMKNKNLLVHIIFMIFGHLIKMYCRVGEEIKPLHTIKNIYSCYF